MAASAAGRCGPGVAASASPTTSTVIRTAACLRHSMIICMADPPMPTIRTTGSSSSALPATIRDRSAAPMAPSRVPGKHSAAREAPQGSSTSRWCSSINMAWAPTSRATILTSGIGTLGHRISIRISGCSKIILLHLLGSQAAAAVLDCVGPERACSLLAALAGRGSLCGAASPRDGHPATSSRRGGAGAASPPLVSPPPSSASRRPAPSRGRARSPVTSPPPPLSHSISFWATGALHVGHRASTPLLQHAVAQLRQHSSWMR